MTKYFILNLKENDWQSSINTHVALSPSSTTRYRPRGGDSLQLEGNRRSGVTLTMHHKFKW